MANFWKSQIRVGDPYVTLIILGLDHIEDTKKYQPLQYT